MVSALGGPAAVPAADGADRRSFCGASARCFQSRRNRCITARRADCFGCGMPNPLETGSLVEVRGERWLLINTASHGAATILTLEGRDRANADQRLRVIDPFDRARRVTSARPKRRPRRAVLRAALGAIVDARSRGGLVDGGATRRSICGRTSWNPRWPPSAARRACCSPTRSGLGKTIQAGLLLSELRERGWIERALIVCPAGLRDTWARELATRFDISATILDQAADRRPRRGAAAWSRTRGRATRVAIASIDFIKRAEVLAALEGEPLDLLIADEAHHLTPGTDRGAAVTRLASRATWCAMLSATPHSGDEAAFALSAEHRRARRSAGDLSPPADRRRACHHQALSRPGCHSNSGRSALFARSINTRARSGASADGKISAVKSDRDDAVEACRVDRAGHRAHAVAPAPAAGDGGRGAVTAARCRGRRTMTPTAWSRDAALSAPGLESAVDERACLEQLDRAGAAMRERLEDSAAFAPARAASRTHGDLHRIPRQPRRRAGGVARASRRAAAIHGGVPADLRRCTPSTRSTRARSMCSSPPMRRVKASTCIIAAASSIDLELPWNPLRLEQRVGRVDRLGQRRTVHAIRMFHPADRSNSGSSNISQLRSRRAAGSSRAPSRHRGRRWRMRSSTVPRSKRASAPSIAGTRVASAAA